MLNWNQVLTRFCATISEKKLFEAFGKDKEMSQLALKCRIYMRQELES